VHVYAGMMVVGLVFVGWFFAVPHANASVVDAGNGDYVVTAAPGVGYSYRWDADGDGKPDKVAFESDPTVKVHLEPGKSQDVRLEVRNSFGLPSAKSIHVARPAEPTSSL
jgi:NADH-quinone oxidoreductase subunit L